MKKKKKFNELIILLVLSFLLSYSVATVLKESFKISRPCDGLLDCPKSYSFPSRHATVVFSLVTTLILQKVDKRIIIVALILALGIVASRVLMGAHTIVDVVGGSLIGVFTGWLVQRIYLLVRKWLNRKI